MKWRNETGNEVKWNEMKNPHIIANAWDIFQMAKLWKWNENVFSHPLSQIPSSFSPSSPLFYFLYLGFYFNQFQFFKYSIQVWVLRAILTPHCWGERPNFHIFLLFWWDPKQLGTFWLNCQLERRTKNAHKHILYILVYIYSIYPVYLWLPINKQVLISELTFV